MAGAQWESNTRHSVRHDPARFLRQMPSRMQKKKKNPDCRENLYICCGLAFIDWVLPIPNRFVLVEVISFFPTVGRITVVSLVLSSVLGASGPFLVVSSSWMLFPFP